MAKKKNPDLLKEIQNEIIDFIIKTLEEDILRPMNSFKNELNFGKFNIRLEENNGKNFFRVITNTGIDDIKIFPRRTWRNTPLKKLYKILLKRKKEEKNQKKKEISEKLLKCLPEEKQIQIDRRNKLNRLIK